MTLPAFSIARPIARPIAHPIAAHKGVGGSLVSLLFSNGEDGFLAYPALAANLFQDSAGTTPVVADADPVGLFVDQSGKVRNATQATSGARPLWRPNSLVPFLQFDATDDNLLSTMTPSATAGSLMAKVKATSSVANKLALGAGTSNVWCAIEVRSNGFVGGRLGTQSSSVITGGGDVSGAAGVIVMTYDASTVTLYWNGTQIYQAARSGSPTTTSAFAIGCANNAGIGAGFFNGGIYAAAYNDRAISPSEVSIVSNLWGTAA